MGRLRSVAELFAGRHFDREVIILCVRCYLRFKMSLRDLVETMAERGLSMAHSPDTRSDIDPKSSCPTPEPKGPFTHEDMALKPNQEMSQQTESSESRT
jgi:hypothetical protein